MPLLTEQQELGRIRERRIERPVLTGRDKLKRMREEKAELQQIIAEENKRKRPRKNLKKLGKLARTLLEE